MLLLRELQRGNLVDMYVNSKMSLTDIANLSGSSPQTVHKRLIRFGIPRRSRPEGIRLASDKIRQSHLGRPSPLKGRKCPSLSGPKNGMWRKHHTNEAREKQRRAWKYEKHFTLEARRRMGESRKGERNPFYGRHWSSEEKKTLRAKLKGRHLHPETEIKKGQHISPNTELTRERVQTWWQDPDYRARVIAGRLKNRRPTGPEKKLIGIIERHNLPFKYTGNGSFILEGLNPDFIETDGRKIAIDVFGDYWHTLKADKESYTEDGRKAIFTKYGWHLIVLWEHEINTMDEREIVQLLRD